MKTRYNRPDDWVYASVAKNGEQPYWPNSIFRVYIKPAAKRIGLKKRIGWHTFRHTLGTILNANGETQSYSGAAASWESQSHHGHVRPSSIRRETQRTDQGCGNASSGCSQGSELA